VIRLDRLVTQMLVEMVRLQRRHRPQGRQISRLRPRLGRGFGDLRAALADVLAFAIQRLGHSDNGSTNGEDR
jgi:hypothetical protein